MRRTKRRLFECLGVLRTSTQTILMQLELAKRLIVELEQDFICGT